MDKKGKITGKKAGKATVTITYTNGSRRIFQVKVQKGIVKTTSVSVNKRNIILAKKGKSFQLKVTLTPVTSQQKVTYKSSNSKVAAVNLKRKNSCEKERNSYNYSEVRKQKNYLQSQSKEITPKYCQNRNKIKFGFDSIFLLTKPKNMIYFDNQTILN